MKNVILPPLKRAAAPKKRLPLRFPRRAKELSPLPAQPPFQEPLARARVSSEKEAEALRLAWDGLASCLALEATRQDSVGAAVVVAVVGRVLKDRGPDAAAALVQGLCSARSRGGLDRAAVLSSDLTADEAGLLTESLQQMEAEDVARARASLNVVGALLQQALKILPLPGA